METACKDKVRTAGAEQQRDNNCVNQQDASTQCVPKLEPYNEDEAGVSGGFSDVCCMCGVRFALLDHHPEHFIKHTDEVCCHLCQMNFSHTNSLALHLKNDHHNYRKLCKSCGMSMGLRKWTMEPDETPKKEILDERVEEVIIKYEEVEINCVKEEEEEVVIGRTEETEENVTTENADNKKMVNINFFDHTYCTIQACNSIRETTNNTVMYTTSDNVLVFVNKTGTTVSPKDSDTESDQQGTPVDDQKVHCIHDHTYVSIQNLAKQVSCNALKTAQVFNNLSATRISPKYLDSPRSEPDQVQNPEMMCRVLLDHPYVRQICKNHPVLLKETPSPNTCRSNTDKANKENLPENQNSRNIVTIADRETTPCSSVAMLESSQLECNIKVEENLGVFEPIQEDVVRGEYEERVHRSVNGTTDSLPMDDSVYTSQNDLYSNTASCKSTGNTAGTVEEGCEIKSLSACLKQNFENTNQKPFRTVDSVKSNDSNSLYKDPRIRDCSNLSEVTNADESVEQSTCKNTSFTCPLCKIVFSTEEKLLNHQAEKHPLAKYVCVRCLQLFSNQKIFIEHVCSKSKEFSVESLTPSNISNNAKEPLHMILNLVPLTPVKQPLSSQSVSSINTVQNLENVSKSTSGLSSNNQSTSASRKLPIQVATRSSRAPKKKAKCLALNGNQGQLTSPISTVTQNQIGQVHVISPLQAKVVTETLFSATATTTTTITATTTTTTTQIPRSPQGQEQMIPTSTPVQVATRSSCSPKKKAKCLALNENQGQLTSPISTVTQNQIGQVHVISPLQAKVVTETSSSATATTTTTFTATTRSTSTTTASKTPLSFQGQEQITPISTPVQVATKPKRCSPKKKATCLALNGTQGQLASPITTVTQNQIGQAQLISLLRAKVVTETSASTTATTTTFTATTRSTTTANQIPFSYQGQEQMTTSFMPVQVDTSSSSSAQKRKATCFALNGNQGQLASPICTVAQNQIGQVQVLSPLQAKVLTQKSSSCTTTSTATTATITTSAAQIFLLSQGQMNPISAVTQTKSAQMHNLTPLQTKVVTNTPTGLTKSIVLPEQHSSIGVPLPRPFLSHVSSSESVLSQTGQLLKSSVPFLNISKSPLSTKIIPSTPEPLKIVSMFVNRSKDLALQKRMRQSWRSKTVFPCRQCGAVSRQFSLGVRHRYQHRGPRLYRCQCGRAFQQRMHLLRHQVKHAEATRYVCAACGQMFYGTQQLACHRPLFRITSSNRNKKANKECRNVFQCYCGHSFTRPAALLWHMLKNSKARKPRLKGYRRS